MKTQLKLICTCWAIILLFVLAASCSSSPKSVKPDTSQKSSITDVPLIQKEHRGIQTERRAVDFKKMEFPTSDDLVIVNSRLHIGSFYKVINLYRDVNGNFPDSYSTLVKSGFLLHWQRNPLTGKPVEVVTGRDLVEDRSDFGSFKYEIRNDTEFCLRFIGLDRDHYNNTGKELWVERAPVYGYHKLDELDEMRGLKVNRWPMNVMGATKTPDQIVDYDKRLLCAMVGNLETIINASINIHYACNETLPESFFDILDNRNFIIKENFEAFAQMLKESGASFKWGFDGNIRYFELIIDGETYIKQCIGYESVEDSPTTGGINPDCAIDESMFDTLDKSSPIITSDNIMDIKIPEEYLISINDIPLGDD
jgi:hypothetical protein